MGGDLAGWLSHCWNDLCWCSGRLFSVCRWDELLRALCGDACHCLSMRLECNHSNLSPDDLTLLMNVKKDQHLCWSLLGRDKPRPLREKGCWGGLRSADRILH